MKSCYITNIHQLLCVDHIKCQWLIGIIEPLAHSKLFSFVIRDPIVTANTNRPKLIIFTDRMALSSQTNRMKREIDPVECMFVDRACELFPSIGMAEYIIEIRTMAWLLLSWPLRHQVNSSNGIFSADYRDPRLPRRGILITSVTPVEIICAVHKRRRSLLDSVPGPSLVSGNKLIHHHNYVVDR